MRRSEALALVADELARKLEEATSYRASGLGPHEYHQLKPGDTARIEWARLHVIEKLRQMGSRPGARQH
jgi:hypothetical protein